MKPSLTAALLTKPSRPPASILSQFAAGEPGGIWLPHFTKSAFQDAAMTIPAAVGMPVIKLLDQSGRGNHMTFANATLQRDESGLLYIACNGTTTGGSTAAIDLTGTDKLTIHCGFKADVAGATAAALEFSAQYDANAGSFSHIYAGNVVYWALRGDTAATSFNTAEGTSKYVHTVSLDIAGAARADEIVIRENGALASWTPSDAAASGGASFGNYALFIARRNGASLPFTGRFYGLILRGVASTAGQKDDAERYMARLTGVNF